MDHLESTSPLLRALFECMGHLGEFMVFPASASVEDEGVGSSSGSPSGEAGGGWHPWCVLDMNWIFRDILPSFFGIDEKQSALSQEAMAQDGYAVFSCFHFARCKNLNAPHIYRCLSLKSLRSLLKLKEQVELDLIVFVLLKLQLCVKIGVNCSLPHSFQVLQCCDS